MSVIDLLAARPHRSAPGPIPDRNNPWLWLGLVGLSHIVAALSASALPVANASFEETSAAGPHGWTFSGPADALAGAWTTNQPFAGGRALRIDGRHGSQRWESTLIPARPEQQYLLRWQTRFLGEKSWRFRAGFCGAEIIFRDIQGRILDSARMHTSCWQTPGWRPGWFLFTTPPNAEAVALRFALETTEPLPGGFDVDTVELDAWPPVASAGSSNLCLLALRIEDERAGPSRPGFGSRIVGANACARPEPSPTSKAAWPFIRSQKALAMLSCLAGHTR